MQAVVLTHGWRLHSLNLSDNKGIDILILGEAIRIGSFFQTNGRSSFAICCILLHLNTRVPHVWLLGYWWTLHAPPTSSILFLSSLNNRAFMIANCFYGGLIHCMCPTSFFFSCHYTPASYHTFHKAIIRRIPLDNHDHDHRVRTVLAGTGASSTVAMVHPPRGSYEEMLTSVTWTISTSPYKEAWTEYKAQATLYTTCMCTPLLKYEIRNTVTCSVLVNLLL